MGIESTSTPGVYNYADIDSIIEGYALQTCGANLPEALTPASWRSTAVWLPKTRRAVTLITPTYVYTQALGESGGSAWTSNTQYLVWQDVSWVAVIIKIRQEPAFA